VGKEDGGVTCAKALPKGGGHCMVVCMYALCVWTGHLCVRAERVSMHVCVDSACVHRQAGKENFEGQDKIKLPHG
jgi:hypothetical protein